MKKIRVHTAFTFNNPDYTKTVYAPGVHNVKNEVADHWFTLRHAEPVDKTEATDDEGLTGQVASLQTQIADLTAQNDDLTAQVTAAAKGLLERNGLLSEKDQQIADLTAQITALTEKTDGAKK